MMWIAIRFFVGVIDGAEHSFAPGDSITDAQAKELGLGQKSDIAKRVKDAQTKKP